MLHFLRVELINTFCPAFLMESQWFMHKGKNRIKFHFEWKNPRVMESGTSLQTVQYCKGFF